MFIYMPFLLNVCNIKQSNTKTRDQIKQKLKLSKRQRLAEAGLTTNLNKKTAILEYW